MDRKLQQLLASNFYYFALQAASDTHPGVDFSKDLYIRVLCEKIQAALTSPGSKLVINLPPRVMKTWLGIYSVAWFLGRRPSREVILVTYTDRLVKEIAYKIRAVMRLSSYGEIFPSTRIAKDRSGVDHFRTTKRGGVFATSTRGSLAGFGADLILTDDANDIADAEYPERLRKTNRIFDTEIMSRRNDPRTAIVINIQHRIGEEDLTAHLMQSGSFRKIAFALEAPRRKTYRFKDGTTWTREKGELLRPGTYSKKELEKKRGEAMYHWLQQQGVDHRSVETISAQHIGVSPSPLPVGPRVVSIDASLKDGPTSSYNVAQVWQVTHGALHLIDQFRGQVAFTEFESAVRKFIKKYRPSAVLIEATANGVVLAERTTNSFPRLSVLSISPKGSKADRLARHRHQIRGGILHLPADVYWRVDFVAEITGNTEFSDQIDATTQFLDFIKTQPALPMPKPRALIAVCTATMVSAQRRVGPPDLEHRGIVQRAQKRWLP